MSEIEQKALALLNECGWGGAHMKRTWNSRYEALCRAIEQHEAFRREVSDACKKWTEANVNCREPHDLDRFIIAKPKPDPLIEAIQDMALTDANQSDADRLREALAKRGGRIVWENEP